MKVGIIVYSHTGNTWSVAQKLEDALKKAGHSVNMEKVVPVNSNPNSGGPVQLKTAPDVSSYDAIIFASPVQAFSLAPVMKVYLSQISDLTNKKVYCFVTQHLKKAWMGGNHAIKQITSACKEKGTDMKSSGMIHWSATTRETQIDELVNRLSAL